MPTDVDQLLREIFGSVTQFSSEQVRKLQTRFQEISREALKDELTKLHAEIADLRNRVAALEDDGMGVRSLIWYLLHPVENTKYKT
jgi:polyhydroxyalkanoate synthesis regulator phasin